MFSIRVLKYCVALSWGRFQQRFANSFGKRAKNTVKLSVFCAPLGSAHVFGAHKTLVKSTHRFEFEEFSGQEP
jgi:hypothetical protein